MNCENESQFSSAKRQWQFPKRCCCMAQSMDSYNVLYLSPFLFRDPTVLTVCGETFISHSLAKRKKEWKIVISLSLRKRCANIKNDLCSTAAVNKPAKGQKKRNSLRKHRRKWFLVCIRLQFKQVTEFGRDVEWHPCLAAAGSGNVLISLQFTLPVRAAVNWLKECGELSPLDIFAMVPVYVSLLLFYSLRP